MPDFQQLAVAEVYESEAVPHLFAPWADRLVERMALAPGERVLDVCCGTGAVTRRAAAAVGPGRVVAVDLSEAMVEVGRRAVGDGTVDWRVGDAQSLPVDDGAFDVALCQFGVMFPPDRAAVFAELARAVRPGGRLGVLTWGSPADNPFHAATREASLAVGRPDPVVEVAFSLADPDELAALARAAGWQQVEVRREEVGLRVGEPDEVLRRQVRMAPDRWADLGADERERWLAILADRLGDQVGGTVPSRANLLTATR